MNIGGDMRKSIIIISLFAVLSIFIGVAVGCENINDGPSLTYTVTNMKELSILMGNDIYFPSDSYKLTEIDLGNPSMLPKELKYAELLNSVTLVYEYPGAEYCRLTIRKKCGEYVCFKDNTDYSVSLVIDREVRMSSGYAKNSDKVYFVDCETLINEVSYWYSFNFTGDYDEATFKAKVDDALAWVKSEIEGYKHYSE